MYIDYREWCSSAKPPILKDELRDLEMLFSPARLPSELVDLLCCFNGSHEQIGESGFYSGVQIMEEHESFVQLFNSAGLVYPRSLIPIFTDGEAVVWFVKAINNTNDSPYVWSFCAAGGDRKIYLEYENIRVMVKTLIEEHKICKTNKYPGTEGHYIDTDALDKVQSTLNKNMYNVKQKGNTSIQGVKNVYEIESLHNDWG